MKKIIKDRWILIVHLMIVILLVLLLHMGWRFTYAPELENNWDAISAVAAWVSILVALLSVGASFYAVYVAIQIPQKVAEKQNKIALFEKRIACYQEMNKLFKIAIAIKEETDIEKIKTKIMVLYCYDESKTQIPKMFHPAELERTISICDQIPFLFGKVDSNDAADLVKKFGKMVISIFQDSRDAALNSINSYVQSMETFKSKYLEEIMATLLLSD